MATERESTTRFKYREHGDEMRTRANQQGGSRDSFIIDAIRTWTPKKGENQVRLMPSTWKNAKHYGYDVWVHFGIGMDNNSYLCLKKMKDEECAICDEQHKAAREDEQELAQALAPKKRVASWIIDRADERTGPQLWVMAWTIDRDICLIAQDKKTKEVYTLDHPDEGFDVYFTRQGEGRNTKYVAFQIDRSRSPISESAKEQAGWLDYIVDNPIPDLLVFQEADKLEKMIGEGLSPSRLKDMKEDKKKRSGDDDDDEKPKRRRSRDEDDEDEAPKKRKASARDDDDDDEAPPKKKPRSRDEDEDEDEEPAPKKRRARDEDEDEEDERPARKKAARDDDEDEDEEPTPKKRRAARDEDEDADEDEESAPKKRKARDEDEDEDEEDAPKARVKSRLSKLKEKA